jgi:hypothetical protein
MVTVPDVFQGTTLPFLSLASRGTLSYRPVMAHEAQAAVRIKTLGAVK